MENDHNKAKRTMSSGRKTKLLLILLTIALLISAVVLDITIHSRQEARGNQPASAGNGSVVENTEDPATAPDSIAGTDGQEVTASLFCASDFQAEPGWPTPEESLTAILAAVEADGKTPDNVVFCGDYTNDRKLNSYQLSPEESIAEIRSAVTGRFSRIDPDDMIFVQGNHDQLTESISPSGLHVFDDYLVYVMNTENDFPWKQGKESGCLAKVTTSSEAMRACFTQLIEEGETRPVFIAGHVPLHFSARTSSRHTTGDNLYSSLVFDAVNDAAKSLDIIYLTGHNHSKGWDCYMGGSSIFKDAGDTILIPEFDESDASSDRYREETLNFTYLNAGYTGYYMNCGPKELDNGTSDQYAAADDTLTGTLFEILPGEISVTRYSADGVHALSWNGEADPYQGGIDRELIPEKYYAKKTESPRRIERKHADKQLHFEQ